MRISLFLGAGASASLNKPTTSMLRQILIKKYNSTSLHDDLIQTLLNIDGFIDIEYVLRCVEEFDDFINKPYGSELIREFERKHLGHQIVAFRSKAYSFSQLESALVEIKNTIENEVFENYSWNHDDDSNGKLDKIFEPLINYINKNSEKIRIFTTNYDRAIEEYCNQKKFVLIDGFMPNELDGRAFWKDGDFSYYDNLDKPKIFLYKLHGSLGWKEHKTEGLERIIYERKSQYPNFTKDLVIYPTLDPKHPTTEEPFASIHKEFDQRMEEIDVCISIGYSFRDSHVNEIFLKFIEKGKIFISISPHSIVDYHKNLLKEDVDEEKRKVWDDPKRSHFIGKTDPDGPENRHIHLHNKRLDEKSINDIIKIINNSIS